MILTDYDIDLIVGGVGSHYDKARQIETAVISNIISRVKREVSKEPFDLKSQVAVTLLELIVQACKKE